MNSAFDHARLVRVLASLWFAISLPACQTLNHAAKIGPAKPTDFLEHAALLRSEPARSPFQGNWTNPSPAAEALRRERTKIWIAPVDLTHLRPMSKWVSRVESNDVAQQRGARYLAEFMRAQFQHAFETSPDPKSHVVDQPAPDALTLELSLVELNPNSVSAGLLRSAISIIAVPGVDTLISRPLRAELAIEGRLRDPRRKLSLFEFADREESQSAVLFAFRDFMTYAQARQAMRNWAHQFEELTRTPPGHRVKEANALTILPW